MKCLWPRRRHGRATQRKRRANRWFGFRRHRFESLEPRQLLAGGVTLAPIDDVTLLAGAPLHIALDGFADDDGDVLSYTISVDGNHALSTFIPEGNRSMRIRVKQSGGVSGDMYLELFEGRAPNTTGRIIELAEEGFYGGLIFHRVIDNFMIQGGDPNGDGTGGSGIDFDDEFHQDLLHTSAGILSMAKSRDDTNDSQFFITTVDTRHLDSNHTVFGFLTDGQAVLEAIEGVDTNFENKPLEDVVIESITVFTDSERGVLMLSAPAGTTGEADVTVAVDDGHGGTDEQTFHVTIEEDLTPATPTVPAQPRNQNPYLLAIDPIHTTVGESADFVVEGWDREADTLYYGGWNRKDWGPFLNTNLDVDVDPGTGQGTVTTINDPVGVHGILVGVNPFSPDDPAHFDYRDLDPYSLSSAATAPWDYQFVPLYIHPDAPTAVELLDSSDTGSSSSDGLTNVDNLGESLWFRVSGVIEGAEVTVYADGVPIGQTTATSQSMVAGAVVVVTDGDDQLSNGAHLITARQVLADQDIDVGNMDGTIDLESELSASLTITIDTAAPVFSSTPVEEGEEGVAYSYDAQTGDEAGGNVSYSLAASPAGMDIDIDTGQITWTPQPGQGPSQQVTVVATDSAGNEAFQPFNVLLEDLPQIDFWQLADNPVTDGQRVRFQTLRSGRLTAEALFAHSAGDVDLTLLDGAGNQLGTSTTDTDNERIDVVVQAGGTYELVVAGDNTLATLRLTNLLVDDGSELTVHGTDGDDTFEFTAGEPHQLVVNGVSYDLDPAATDTITIDGHGGNDTATLIGTDAAENAALAFGGSELVGDQYEVGVISVASITIDGGGGADVAKLFDSPGDDTLAATPDETTLSGDGFSLRAKSFEAVHAYATAGGTDSAELQDSAGDDHFYTSPVESAMYGDGFYNRAKGFESLSGRADAGGFDEAELFDSAGDDLLVGSPDRMQITTADGFEGQAWNFDDVNAFATLGGDDKAELSDSVGNDLYVGSPIYGALSGEGFHNRTWFFDTVLVNASQGGYDQVKLFDSVGDDVFIGYADHAVMHKTGEYYHDVSNFDGVHAYATAGGTDVAQLYDSAEDDFFYSDHEHGALFRPGQFYNRAKYFEIVYGDADLGGNDSAEMYDSQEVDLFEADLNWARLSNQAADFLFEISDFDHVKATASTQGDLKSVADALDFTLDLQGPWQDQ